MMSVALGLQVATMVDPTLGVDEAGLQGAPRRADQCYMIADPEPRHLQKAEARGLATRYTGS